MNSGTRRESVSLISSSSGMPRGQASYGQAAGPQGRPEMADIGRLARRFMTRTVAAARAEEESVSRLLGEHLGAQAAAMPLARGSWPAYDQVNVQTGLDACLAEPGRSHHLVGLTHYRHRDFGLADLMQPGQPWSPGIGNVATEALPAGPGGVTRSCVQCGLYFITDADGAAVLLVRGPEEHSANDDVNVEVASVRPGRAQEIADEIRRLSLEHNVFRGHVIAFRDEVFDHHRGALLSFVDRPQVARDEVILPPEILDGIERQVLGVARHASRLLASGQRPASAARGTALRRSWHGQDPYAAVPARPAAGRPRRAAVRPRAGDDLRRVLGGPGAAAVGRCRRGRRPDRRGAGPSSGREPAAVRAAQRDGRVLLYGVPGTGKTHTLRYLLGRLPGVTAVLLSGRALGMISAACSVEII